MSRNRYLIVVLLLPLLAVSWLLLVASLPARGQLAFTLITGFLYGSKFGQATLASAWTALGPGPIEMRMPLSIAWIALLAITHPLREASMNLPVQVGYSLVEVGGLTGIWLLVQLPLWGLVFGYGVRLRHCSDAIESSDNRRFGIRQLLIVTTIVAIALVVARWVVAWSAGKLNDPIWAIAMHVYLTAGLGVVKSLPLLIATLLPRFAWLALFVMLIVIAVVTWYEAALVMPVVPPGFPDHSFLVSANGFQIAWVLVVAGLLRACGYRIAQSYGHSPIARTPVIEASKGGAS